MYGDYFYYYDRKINPDSSQEKHGHKKLCRFVKKMSDKPVVREDITVRRIEHILPQELLHNPAETVDNFLNNQKRKYRISPIGYQPTAELDDADTIHTLTNDIPHASVKSSGHTPCNHIESQYPIIEPAGADADRNDSSSVETVIEEGIEEITDSHALPSDGMSHSEEIDIPCTEYNDTTEIQPSNVIIPNDAAYNDDNASEEGASLQILEEDDIPIALSSAETDISVHYPIIACDTEISVPQPIIPNIYDTPKSEYKHSVWQPILLIALLLLSLPFIGKLLWESRIQTALSESSAMSINSIWEHYTGGTLSSTAVLGDINGDHMPDVIIGSQDTSIYAIDGRSGLRIFSYATHGPVISSPVLTDIDNDGYKEIIVGSGDGTVYALDRFGRCIWSSEHKTVQFGAIHASPALERINADRIDDVVVASMNGAIAALDGKHGYRIWQSKEQFGAIFSSPTLVDVNHNRGREIFFGTQSGEVVALEGKQGWKLWKTMLSGSIIASPLVTDYNNDGRYEVIIGTRDGVLASIDALSGTINWKHEGMPAIISSAVAGDINNDGYKEYIVGLGNGRIVALHGNGDTVWQFDTGTQDEIAATAALYDINADSCDDVFIPSRNGTVYIINGKTGTLLTEKPYTINVGISSSPVLGDLNGDRNPDIVFGCDNGSVYALTVVSSRRFHHIGKNKIIWGAFQGNSQHSGSW